MGAGGRTQPLETGRRPISQPAGSHVALRAQQEHAAPGLRSSVRGRGAAAAAPMRYPSGSPHCAPSWVLLACAQVLVTILHLPEQWDVPKERAWLSP